MLTVKLGSTGLTVNKNGFGALPIQRVSHEDAVYLLRKALNAGITYYDTSRAYSDSEEKIGAAFEKERDKVIIASKTQAKEAKRFWTDLETSLKNLRTDYIDIYQFHNIPFCPKPGDGTGLYEAMLEAKEKGIIRHIGITNHRLSVANEAVDSGLYEVLMFPFSYVSGQKDIDLVNKCKNKNVGFVAMKGLAGGLLNNYKVCYAFMSQFENVLPIWGIQRERELDEWISCIDNPPAMTDDLKIIMDKDRAELSGEFCRSCGYCMPCTVGIKISQCARMIQSIRRSPVGTLTTPEVQANMMKIKECIDCGVCKTRCPYELDIPNLLRKNLADYEQIIAGKTYIGPSEVRKQ